MLTLRQLNYFEILSRHLHFGKAADECAVSQPALSMQIKELETDLGVSLVERSKSGISLTREGKEVLEKAHTILRMVQDLQEFVKHRVGILTGPLVLGAIPTIAPYLLPRALPAIRKQYPDLQLKLRESQTSKLIAELKQGQLDVILLALPIDDEDLTTLELLTDHFLLATTDNSKKKDPFDILAQEDLILLEEGHCLRDQILTFCREKKPDALSGFGATSLTTVTQMVANGFGTTLLPELAKDVEIGKQSDINLLRFSSPEPKRTIGLAWRKTSPRTEDYQALGALLKDIGTELLSKP